MRKFAVSLALLAFAWGCSTAGGPEWQRADGSPESDAIAKRRAEDIADCGTEVAAPTPGVQSAAGISRGQFRDCMYRKGWRMAQ